MRVGIITTCALSVLAAVAVMRPGEASARDLTVAAWGGSSQAAQKKLYYAPFSAKTGTRIVEDSWSGGIGILRTKVQGGNANWDLVQVEADELNLGCEEGLFEKLDWTALGGRERFVPGAAHECGVGSVVWTTGLVYDANRFKDGPKNWVDFWDLKRFPGKRALRKGPKYTLEAALMADGVEPKDVYKVLRTPAGVDRAFKKLDEIKKDVVWWTAGAQGPQLLASGEVALANIYASRALSANRSDGRNFKVVWNQSVYAIDYFVILKGSPNRAKAVELLSFMTQPEVQKDFPGEANQGITTIAANKQVPKAVSANLPTDPENEAVALALDVDFWVDNVDQLTQRFNAWASR
ncbi:polyamine ABC transporter substrate-binding protein [Enterovirga rhinocerotis]|uniref:Putative spermidine/putrescine transport system substrate-binding protein n=1 Tax=Enterovirga rhinocerotis TaxID=1339210 RepID=A0A4R7C3G5_9HYPH|nr:ABC transporter substrate-binding protein [Enterovirga rhinocerotis]TDR92948.1 putative spermidine/putrescine transport system substrate-binding protein [Enterovirga rhinocerotis]